MMPRLCHTVEDHFYVTKEKGNIPSQYNGKSEGGRTSRQLGAGHLFGEKLSGIGEGTCAVLVQNAIKN